MNDSCTTCCVYKSDGCKRPTDLTSSPTTTNSVAEQPCSLPGCIRTSTTCNVPPAFALAVCSSSFLSYIITFFAPLPNSPIICLEAFLDSKPIDPDTTDDTTEDVQADSPAAPGNPDTTPVSRSSTPPSRVDVPPQTQPEEAAVQASVEDAVIAIGNVDNPGTVDSADRSIFDLLEECIPEGSKSVLESVIYQRPRARISLKWDDDFMERYTWKPEAAWKQVDGLKPSEHIVLVIDSIDDKWCEALCNRYPKAINKKFVLEHILGLDAQARLPDPGPRGEWRGEWHEEELGEELKEELKEMPTADLKRLDRIFPCFSELIRPDEHLRSHVGCWLDPEKPAFRTCSVRGCQLSLISSKWPVGQDQPFPFLLSTAKKLL